MGIFQDSDNVTLKRIYDCATLARGETAQWPVVYTFETEAGELAVIEEFESVRLIRDHRYVIQPKYVMSILEDTYGVPIKRVGRSAIAYLNHRFNT